jgi:hypothetical protein
MAEKSILGLSIKSRMRDPPPADQEDSDDTCGRRGPTRGWLGIVQRQSRSSLTHSTADR